MREKCNTGADRQAGVTSLCDHYVFTLGGTQDGTRLKDFNRPAGDSALTERSRS